jgi:glutamyl-tRNA reductase
VAAELEIVLLGLSHRSAPLEVRERCALAAEEIGARLGVLLALDGVREAWLISTCNRTEVVVAAPALDAASAASLRATLRDLVFRNAPPATVYEHKGLGAVIHLFRVASGLDSLVLGESQILTQVKDAFQLARGVGATGQLLEPLLQQALSTGKRVRSETSVGAGTLSVARAGVDVAAHVFGTFEDVRALVVGAGETGRLVAQHLKQANVGALTFANRSLANAEAAASEHGARAITLEALDAEIGRSDLVVVCVEGAAGLVDEASFAGKVRKSRDRPVVVVDLSVPRAVAAGVAELTNLLCYDLEDLARIVQKNRGERQRAAEEAAPILLAEVHKFLSLRTYAAFSPAIGDLHARFDAAREQALDAIAGARSSPEMVELAHKLTRQLFDVALDQLKRTARDTVEPDYLDRAYQRFLDEA